MDSSSRIALGIVGAALILLFGGISYHEFERQRDIADAQAMLQSVSGSFTALAQQSQQQIDQQRAQQAEQVRQSQLAAYADKQRHWLAANQRCVGGVVVQVDGTSYTQLGSIASPVRCSGQMADRPLR
jgi:hypothetical protein